jgi:hypothetical protein
MTIDSRRRFHPLLVGAFCGVTFADLLLGLNPALLDPPSGARFIAGGAALGVTLSLVAFSTRTERPSRTAWVFLAFLLAALAFFVELQRSFYFELLGNGARRILVATTLVAGASALLSALGAALRPGTRETTRAFSCVLALALLVPFAGRRAPERTPLAAATNLPRTATRSVIVVGLEGASWDLLAAWASEGRLPVFARLLSEGAGGPLESAAPYDRAPLWVSAATGKRPSRHGVLASRRFATPFGDLRLVPRFPGAAPVTWLPLSPSRPDDSGRRSLTFWEILALRDHEAAVLNWPASYPARAGLTLWATPNLFEGDEGPEAGLPVPAAREAALFHVKVPRLDRPLVRSLVPAGLSPEDRRGAAPLESAARDLSVLHATLGSVPSGPNSVSAVVLAGLTGPGRRFGPSAEPARYWGRSPQDADVRARALLAYYRFLDEEVGELLERKGKDRTIIIFSPVGWGPPPPLSALARFLSGKDPESTPEASQDGFIVLSGSGIRAGVRLTSARVYDVAPTLLVLSGEPIARDMDGRVLAEAFDERFSQSASIPVVTTFEPEGPQ